MITHAASISNKSNPRSSAPAPVPAPVPALAAKRAYMPYGDAARVIGTMAVVLGHVADMVVFSRSVSVTDWWTANLIDAATRWAVPVYIMLSGALLLDPERLESPAEFYWKRLARLGAPIFFWSAFYMLFSVYYTQDKTSGEVWKGLLLGQPYPHLHFVYRIAGLYAFTPVLREFLTFASRKTVTLAVILLLGFSMANSVLDGVFQNEQSMFARFVPFLGYFLLGYLLRDRKLSKRALIGCWLLAISCILLLAGGTGVLVAHYGNKPYPSLGFLLYDFLSPVRVSLAICAWLIVINSFGEEWLASRPGRIVAKYIAPTTLGLYLIHMAVRDVYFYECAKHGINALWPNVLIGIPLAALGIYLVSFALVFVLSRIPLIKRLVA